MIASRRKRLRAIAVVAGAVAVSAAGNFGGMAAWRHVTAAETVFGAIETGCDLQRGPCYAHFPGGGKIEVVVTPRPIPLLRPVTVTVELRGIPAKTVEVDFSSPDMYMGYNRRALEADGVGRFSGQSVLPVCILDRMRWTLTVTAGSGWAPREARFPFETITDRRKLGV
jgi:hypothetical protein